MRANLTISRFNIILIAISNHFLYQPETENALVFNCNWDCAKSLHYNLIYKGLCESVLKQLYTYREGMNWNFTVGFAARNA